MSSTTLEPPRSLESEASQRLAAVSARLISVSARMQRASTNAAAKLHDHAQSHAFPLQALFAFALAICAVMAAKFGLLAWLTW